MLEFCTVGEGSSEQICLLFCSRLFHRPTVYAAGVRLLTSVFPDRYTIPDRNEIRHVLYIPSRRAGRDHEAGAYFTTLLSLAFINPTPPGEALREGNACFTHLLFNIGIDKCAEDLQDRASEGVRPEMRHTRDRRRGRAGTDVCRRIVSEGDDVWRRGLGSGGKRKRIRCACF